MATELRSSISELQSLARLLDQYERVYTRQRVAFFAPLPKQKQATEWLNDSTAVVLMLGGNRTGKTVWGVCEAIAHSLGYRPWLPEDDPNRIVRLTSGKPIPVPNVGRIVAQNYQQAIMQTIWPKIEEWAPAGMYAVKRDNRGIPVSITWKNGSKMYLMSNDQDDMAFEGPNGHWAWFDEPPDYTKYVGIKRGLIDFSGHLWLTLTPLTQPWIDEILVDRANEADGAVRMVKVSIWENCIDNGGHLRREDIEEFLGDLREAEYEARAHGNFMHKAGLVYKEWRPESPYWIKPFDIPRDWPRVCVIDPHPRKPVAVMWMAFAPTGQRYVYRDMFDNNLHTIRQVADAIKEAEGWNYISRQDRWVRPDTAEPVAIRLIDNSSREQERTSGDTIWSRFMAEGITCQLARKRNAEAGYDAIHEAFRLKNEWSKPGLILFNSCTHTKQNLMNFCWDTYATSKQRDLMGDKQQVRKNHDDFIDCIRYTYQSTFTYHGLKALIQSVDRGLVLTASPSTQTPKEYGWQTMYE